MKLLASAPLVAACLLWAGFAQAQRGYPPLIDSTLGVNVESILPPHGCELCHTDPNGGTASLRPFGELMVSRYALISTTMETTAADQSVVTACAQLKMDQSQLVQDLQKGVDPNADLANTPLPGYGCDVGPGGSAPGAALLSIGALATALAMRRRLRSYL